MTVSETIPIGFAITELDPGGAERAFTHIVTHLNRSRWAPMVYCLSGRGELAEQIQSADVPVHFLDAGGKSDFGLVGRFANQLRQDRPRILQTFLHHANLAGRFAACRAGVPIVVSGIRVAEERSRWRLRLDRWTQNRVSMNVCVSQSVMDFSRDSGGLLPEKLCVIRNGVDFDRFSSATPIDWTNLGLPSSARVILVVGRLDMQKRPILAFNACLPLLNQYQDLHLVFAGIGPDRDSIDHIAESKGLSDHVHCLGTRNDIPELMRGSQLLLHVSAWEGAPNVILEAIASGLPIVATDTPGNRDAWSEGNVGYLVNDSSHEIEQAVRQILDQREILQKQLMQAQDSLRASRSWQSTVAEYENLYHKLLLQS